MTKTYESWFWIFNGRCRSLLWPCGSCNWAVLLLSGGIWWIRLHPLLCLLCQSEFNQILSLLLPLLVLLLVAITLIPRGAHQRPLPQSTTPWLRRFLLALSFACGWQILCEVQQRRSLSEPRGLGRLGTGLGTLWKVESGSHAHRWLFNRPTASTWCCEPLPIYCVRAGDYRYVVKDFSEGTISHGFPSQAEARIYCHGAGVQFPSQPSSWR